MKVLPFYTSTGQRDAEKVGSQDALLCPRHKLLPFQIQREHSNSSYITSVKLVDCAGDEKEMLEAFYGSETGFITNWTNGIAPNNYSPYADDRDWETIISYRSAPVIPVNI